ncbi:MAG: monomethylamine:corrinoid methyltransferase [Thermodesulfobacteriota bacterium]
MPELFDYLERSVTGSMMTEKDFLMKILIPNIRKVVDEFGIQFDLAVPISSDNDMADRLFEAAIEFISITGLYCESTNRVIAFERDEIREGMAAYQNAGIFGEDEDRHQIKPRKPEDGNLPWCHLGNGIAVDSEEIAMALVEGYAGIPQVRSVTIPVLDNVQGRPVLGGTPFELYSVIESVATARKALNNAGRPGLPILNLNPAATTAGGAIAGCYPSTGSRVSDGWLIDYTAEMKIDKGNLNKLAFVKYMGGNVGSTDLAILGGYAGGAPGTALLNAAYQILGGVFMNCNYHLSGPVEMNFGCTSTRAALWVYSMVGRAISRNTNFCVLANQYAVSGPGTKTYFYEAAAELLAVVTSGYAGFESCHPAKGVLKNGITPTEPQFNARLAHSIANSGLSSEQACEICIRLLETYEQDVKSLSPVTQGRTYPELYDLKTRKRSEAYSRLVDEVVEVLVQLGVPFE